MHHTIVVLEGLHCPIPEFSLPEPHTSALAVHHNTSATELHSRVKDATIIITTTVKLNAEVLSPGITPNLQLVAVMASGTDCVDLEACEKRGIRVCNCPHASTEVVSEHAIGLYFAARRKTLIMHNLTVSEPSEWKENGSVASYMKDIDGGAPLSCQDEVCGIIGYGALGKHIAKLAQAVGMKVLISDRKTGRPPTTKGSSPTRVPFYEVLKQSTVLILCLPRTPDSLNLISTAEFKTMSKHCVLINVARGGIVDENALLAALKENQIAGAGTDVFAVEPAEGIRDSPLLDSGAKGLNLTLTPHVAWFGERTKQNLQRIIKANIELFAAETPQNLVA